jgi:hypothetical protein
MDTPDDYLQNRASMETSVYYLLTSTNPGLDALQNGADNVRLLDAQNNVVDAVGYGDFQGLIFVGEGTPVPDGAAGRSIGRVYGANDSDDNSVDFQTFYPTPGQDNADLIINEVYFDQPGQDDANATFIELVAPVLDWEDLSLDGYMVHAVNGFDGFDYIFTGFLPGIDLGSYTLLGPGPDKGFVLICNDQEANFALLFYCNAYYDGVDFQNGPDNIELYYRGRKIDALGYGMFGVNHYFYGEGSAASFDAADAGQSLGRWPATYPRWLVDLDDNSIDFEKLTPTPGLDNPFPT